MMQAPGGIHLRRAPGRDSRGKQSDYRDGERRGGHGRGIARLYAENQVIEEARRGPSAWYAKSNSDDGQAQGVEAGPAQDGGWARAEGQPYRNLGFAAGHPIAEQSVDADRGSNMARPANSDSSSVLK